MCAAGLSELRGWELPIAVVVRFALLGVRELYSRLRGVHAQGLALDKPVVVANLYDLRLREVGFQLLALRPRDPKHARGFEVSLESRERVVELGLGSREKVDVVELSTNTRRLASISSVTITCQAALSHSSRSLAPIDLFSAPSA